MVCDGDGGESPSSDPYPWDGDRPAAKLDEIVPEELARATVEAVLQQLDRLAIYLFPSTKMAGLRDVAERDQKVREPWTFRSAIGQAVVCVANYARTGVADDNSLLDSINCIWGAAYTRAIDPTSNPQIETLGNTEPLDIVLRAARARYRLAAGRTVSVPDLAMLGNEEIDVLRRELVLFPVTVPADVAQAWLRARAIEGFEI